MHAMFRRIWRKTRGIAVLSSCVAVLAGCTTAASPTPTSAPGTAVAQSPVASVALDEHSVALDGASIRFATESGAFVVTLERGGTSTELARVGTTSESPAASDLAQTRGYAMVCPQGASPATYYVFGTITPPSMTTYSGPPARGQGARDGLFLYALDSQVLEPTARIAVTGAGEYAPSLQFAAKAFDIASSSGQLQSSGCRVSG